jgi:molybdate-binding protein
VQLLRDLDTGSRLLMAGCDPATSVLARYLQRASVTLVTAPVNNSVALQLVGQHMVHVAGTHSKDPLKTQAASRQGRNQGARDLRVRRVGARAGSARGNPKKIRKVEDLARAGVNFVNREKSLAAASCWTGC